MADNVSLPLTGAGGTTATVATDEVSSAHYQYVKPAFGADGTATPVSSANPLPVTGYPVISATANNVGSVVSVGVGASVEVLAANSARRCLTIIPEGDVYMSLGGTASASNGKLLAYTPYNLTGVYSGAISMLSVTGTINVNVWEV